MAWWGPGNEYDAYTYSPDRMVGTASTPLWTHVDENSLRLPQGKTIGDILGANFQTVAASTPVMNTTSGGAYNYTAAWYDPVGQDLTEFRGRISSSGLNESGQPIDSFRPGTVSVRPIMLTNRGSGGANTISWQDVSFQRVEQANETYATDEVVTLRPTGLADAENYTFT